MPKGVPNRRYSPEFKIKAVETMRAEGLNYSEASRRFGIEAHTLLLLWERIYLAEGPEGFSVERRKLLRLVDVQNMLREEISLASFMAGFKLAWGLAQELEADGLYSFEDEEEERALRRTEREAP